MPWKQGLWRLDMKGRSLNMSVDAAQEKEYNICKTGCNYSLAGKLTIVEFNQFEEIVDVENNLEWISSLRLRIWGE